MIIAEASLQHQGSIIYAENCVQQAHGYGADAIKFQLFVRDEPLFCPLEGDEARWDKWMASVLPQATWEEIKTYCDEIGIDFMASTFQPGAVELYKSLNPKWWKVASRAAKTFPYDVAGGPFIVSLGANPDPVLRRGHKLLQCWMKYPHPPKAWELVHYTAGLSDHSGSPWPSIHALARGAEIIEVHVDFGRPEKLPEEVTLDELKLICEARDAFAALR